MADHGSFPQPAGSFLSVGLPLQLCFAEQRGNAQYGSSLLGWKAGDWLVCEWPYHLGDMFAHTPKVTRLDLDKIALKAYVALRDDNGLLPALRTLSVSYNDIDLEDWYNVLFSRLNADDMSDIAVLKLGICNSIDAPKQTVPSLRWDTSRVVLEHNWEVYESSSPESTMDEIFRFMTRLRR